MSLLGGKNESWVWVLIIIFILIYVCNDNDCGGCEHNECNCNHLNNQFDCECHKECNCCLR